MPGLLLSQKRGSSKRNGVATLTRGIRSQWSPAERAWRRQVAQVRLTHLLRQLEAGMA